MWGEKTKNKHNLEKHVYIATSRLSTCLEIWQWGFKIVDAEPTYTIYPYETFAVLHKAQSTNLSYNRQYKYNCERSDLSSEFNSMDFLYISVSGCTSCRKYSKCFYQYPPSAIFRNANINTQHDNVTGSMNWHITQLRPPM